MAVGQIPDGSVTVDELSWQIPRHARPGEDVGFERSRRVLALVLHEDGVVRAHALTDFVVISGDDAPTPWFAILDVGCAAQVDSADGALSRWIEENNH